MKSFVVLSFYQLAHAIAMTLDIGEPADLYFNVNHLGVRSDLIDRIRQTGVFHDVIMIDHTLVNKALSRELEKTADADEQEIDRIGNSLFEKYLTPFYEKIFSGADFDDDLYLYNDFQPHYYYIAGHFSRITGIEDGYAVLEKQMNLINHTGIESFNHGKNKSAFVGKYWPLMQWKNPQVKRVLSSIPLTQDAPEYLREKVSVLDFKDLKERHRQDYDQAMRTIFDIDLSGIRPDSSLVLTQPFSRNKYCSALENFLFHRKMIREELDRSAVVYVKPHPADRTDYSVLADERVVILDRRFPVEMMDDDGISFRRVVTYMSAAADHLKAEEHVKFNDEVDVDRDQIVKGIRDYIVGEKAALDLFVRCRQRSAENYAQLYMMVKKRKRVDVRVHLLCGSPEDEEYYGFAHAEERLDEYFGSLRDADGLPLWAEEIRQIPDFTDEKAGRLRFLRTADQGDAAAARLMAEHGREFVFLTDIGNTGVELNRDVLGVFVKYSVRAVHAFPVHTVIDGVRCDLGTGAAGDCMTNTPAGRILHISFLRQLLEEAPDVFDGFRIIRPGIDRRYTFARNDFYTAPEDCALLREEPQALADRIRESTDPDEAACLIGALQALLDADNLPEEKLSDLLPQEAGAAGVLREGLIRAMTEAESFRKKERSRFLHVREEEFRYAKDEIGQLIRDGTIGRMKAPEEEASKETVSDGKTITDRLKSRIRRKKS